MLEFLSLVIFKTVSNRILLNNTNFIRQLFLLLQKQSNVISIEILDLECVLCHVTGVQSVQNANKNATDLY